MSTVTVRIERQARTVCNKAIDDIAPSNPLRRVRQHRHIILMRYAELKQAVEHPNRRRWKRTAQPVGQAEFTSFCKHDSRSSTMLAS